MKRTPIKRKSRLVRRTRLRPTFRKRDRDVEFATLIKERDGWTCQWTGQRHSRIVQACHVFAKQSHPATRYDDENVLTLCSACHFRSHHGYYEEFRDFVVARMGQSTFDALKRRALGVEDGEIAAGHGTGTDGAVGDVRAPAPTHLGPG